MQVKEKIKPRGRVEVFVTKGKPKIIPGELISNLRGHKVYRSAEIDFSNTKVISKEVVENIIVNAGKDMMIEGLTTGFGKVVARMAIGDRGTIPSDSTIPKVPLATMDALYNEVYRDDLDTTVLDIGTPTTHEAKFIKTFSALDINISAFSNQSNPVVNEVGLIMADLLAGNPLPRPPVEAPNSPDADEELYAIRTFKSVPFEAANEISITFRYTVFIE